MASGSRAGTTTSTPDAKPGLARSVSCDEHDIIVTLEDGRVIRAPLSERLRAATPAQRATGVVEDFGTALHWPEVDEDLSVAHLLGVSEEEVMELAGFEPAPTSD